MAEYLIQGKTLDEIAHAINEKGGWQNIYRADEMAEAIDSIPTGGGGGSLPSVISKIDGGSFTFASDTAVSEQITHNLGVIPICVMVWCDVEPYPNLYFGGLFNNPVNNNVYRIIGLKTGGNMTSNSNYQGTAPLANVLTSEFWSLNHTSYKYDGGVSYKWLAWA